MHAALFKVCQRAVEAKPQKPGEARAFFEQNFRPIRISPLGTPDGFVTGYYEPIVEGAQQGRRLRLSALPQAFESFAGRPNGGGGRSGRRRRQEKGRHGPRRKLVSFYDRTAIDDGVLAGRNLEICWLKDPIDSFFIHIQGSVRVVLDDGKLMRLNYEAANGHPYYAVGRWLIDRKIVPKDEMSMDRIREWMERNPKEGEELRQKNKSYVFFRETHLPADHEPSAPGHFAHAWPLDRGRPQAAHLWHAFLHLGLSADPEPEAGHLVSPPDDRAGHRRRDRRAGARRYLFRRGRRGGERRRAAAPRRPLRHAGAEGAGALDERRNSAATATADLEQMAEYAKTVAKDEATGEGKSEPETKAAAELQLKPAGVTAAKPARKPAAKVAARSPKSELKKSGAGAEGRAYGGQEGREDP